MSAAAVNLQIIYIWNLHEACDRSQEYLSPRHCGDRYPRYSVV